MYLDLCSIESAPCRINSVGSLVVESVRTRLLCCVLFFSGPSNLVLACWRLSASRRFEVKFSSLVSSVVVRWRWVSGAVRDGVTKFSCGIFALTGRAGRQSA